MFTLGLHEVADGVWAYLQRHGSRLLGLVRAGAYALYGRSAYPRTGTDQVYGNDVARFLADSDRPDQLVLTLYGSLAAAMAPGTFVSGEAASVAPLGDSPLRSMYLPPNGASNAAFLETVRLLLAKGADVKARETGLGHTALMFAAIENHPAIVQALAEAGAELEATSTLIETPDVNPAKGIASDGARGAFPKGALTPLLLAARHGSVDAIRALVKAGARIDQPQVDGITPLIMAIFNGHYDTAAALIERAAALFVKA